MKPIQLPPNLIQRPYLGGEGIAKFRGIPSPGPDYPEDWVGSTTTVYNQKNIGLSHLKNGRSLREAIQSDPSAFLGPDHVRVYGTDPGLLVKLLDARQRLSVQAHPDRAFAREFLNSKYGKSEAWLILDTFVDDPFVYLGFQKTMELAELEHLVDLQDKSSLIALLNPLKISVGDCIFIPAGIPHAIGNGLLLVEVQEPSDWLLRMEWAGYKVGNFPSDMGLGMGKALQCLNCSACTAETIDHLWHRRSIGQAKSQETEIESLLPVEADQFFRLERIRPIQAIELEPAYSLLIVSSGLGELKTSHGESVSLVKGATWLIPWSSGSVKVTGNVEVIRCLPPSTQTQSR